MIFASCVPSRTFGRGFRAGPSKAGSNPSVTSRSRRFSTVCRRQPYASAIRASVQAGPSASAFKRMLALRTFCDDPLSFRTTCSKVARSASVSRTIYFFFMAQPSVVAAMIPEIDRVGYPKLLV